LNDDARFASGSVICENIMHWSREQVEERVKAYHTRDPYGVLNLQRPLQRRRQQVRTQYFRLAEVFHPDKASQDQVSEPQRLLLNHHFDIVNKAYAVLSDERRSSVYDDLGIAGVSALDSLSQDTAREWKLEESIRSSESISRNVAQRYQLALKQRLIANPSISARSSVSLRGSVLDHEVTFQSAAMTLNWIASSVLSVIVNVAIHQTTPYAIVSTRCAINNITSCDIGCLLIQSDTPTFCLEMTRSLSRTLSASIGASVSSRGGGVGFRASKALGPYLSMSISSGFGAFTSLIGGIISQGTELAFEFGNPTVLAQQSGKSHKKYPFHLSSSLLVSQGDIGFSSSLHFFLHKKRKIKSFISTDLMLSDSKLEIGISFPSYSYSTVGFSLSSGLRSGVELKFNIHTLAACKFSLPVIVSDNLSDLDKRILFGSFFIAGLAAILLKYVVVPIRKKVRFAKIKREMNTVGLNLLENRLRYLKEYESLKPVSVKIRREEHSKDGLVIEFAAYGHGVQSYQRSHSESRSASGYDQDHFDIEDEDSDDDVHFGSLDRDVLEVVPERIDVTHSLQVLVKDSQISEHGQRESIPGFYLPRQGVDMDAPCQLYIRYRYKKDLYEVILSNEDPIELPNPQNHICIFRHVPSRI